MNLTQAIEKLKAHIAKQTQLPEGWQVDICWEDQADFIGVRVAEVTFSTHGGREGYCWMQVDDGVALCAQVERCILAHVEDMGGEKISLELTALDKLIKTH